MRIAGLILNAQEVVLIDRLIDTGLYGTTRSGVIRNILDRELVVIFGR